jgi:hypothetical protein
VLYRSLSHPKQPAHAAPDYVRRRGPTPSAAPEHSASSRPNRTSLRMPRLGSRGRASHAAGRRSPRQPMRARSLAPPRRGPSRRRRAPRRTRESADPESGEPSGAANRGSRDSGLEETTTRGPILRLSTRNRCAKRPHNVPPRPQRRGACTLPAVPPRNGETPGPRVDGSLLGKARLAGSRVTADQDHPARAPLCSHERNRVSSLRTETGTRPWTPRHNPRTVS